MKTKPCNLSAVKAMGINLLRGLDSVWITKVQVAQIETQYRSQTGEGFRYPDYTIEVYNGQEDGFNLHRAPNGAGLLKRVKHSEVTANAEARNREREVNRMASELMELFDSLAGQGINPRENPEWLSLQQKYREFCANKGNNYERD